jgi:hypothetical protein
MLQPQFESDDDGEQGDRSGKKSDHDAPALGKIGGLDIHRQSSRSKAQHNCNGCAHRSRLSPRTHACPGVGYAWV